MCDPKSESEAESLFSATESFEFRLGRVIWDEILFAINRWIKSCNLIFFVLMPLLTSYKIQWHF